MTNHGDTCDSGATGRPDASLPCRLPPDIHFECLCCGDCCRNYWEIQVEDEAVERIHGLDWRVCSSLGSESDSPFEGSKTDPEQMVFRRMAGSQACNFLDEDNLCRLHKRYGFDSKPHICRQYPFRFVTAPDGVYVGVSFACPAVVEGRGPLVFEQGPLIEKELSKWAAPRTMDPAVRIDQLSVTDWDRYLSIERCLDEILATEDHPVGKCLIAGHVWLGMLSRLLSATRSQASGPSASEAIDGYIAHSRGERYERAFAIAARDAAQPRVKRLLIRSFVAFRASFMATRSRWALPAAILWRHARELLRAGAFTLPPLEQPIPYRDFRPEAADLDTPEFQALLRRYFRHCLFRKDPIHETDLFLGYGFLGLWHGLIQHYASALQALGRPDPLRALMLVESSYVHHSDLKPLFMRGRWLSGSVRALFERPNFAHTVIEGWR